MSNEFIKNEDIPSYGGGQRGSKYDKLFEDVPIGFARKITDISTSKTSYIRRMAHERFAGFTVEVHAGILYISNRGKSKDEE